MRNYLPLMLFISITIGTNASEILAANTQTPASNKVSASANKTQSALELYNQKRYAEAAALFEDVIKSSQPNATLYYYAALANQQSHKGARATQLLNYIITNFPNAKEAAYAQKLLAYKQSSGSAPSKGTSSELPESEATSLPATTTSSISDKSVVMHPISAEEIARDGAAGIDQGKNPNCWFEASIAALAQLPRGQRLLADSIRYKRGGTYVIRFHNDGVEYNVSQEDLTKSGIRDKSLWASLIECAQLKKFPDNAGANGADNDLSRLEVGLGSITGHKAEIVNPQGCDPQELSSFIGSAIKTKNPIVAATYGDAQLAYLPSILVGSHAYTVIDFDPAKNIVTVRNPHGRKSKVFTAPANSTDIEFQQLSDGVVKLGLPTFQKYFHSVARSFI